MIDGSHVPFEDNMALTESVTKVANAMGVPVEAELGKVGGKEDDGPAVKGENPFTDPDEAKEFVERTKCSSLAVGVGTAHGVYKGTPHIEQEILKEIRSKVEVPLVLHGASGLTDEQVRECVKRGICKVNFATELRNAYSRAVAAVFEKDPAVIDPKKYGEAAIEAVKTLVEARMKVCGCAGKA